MVTPIKSLNVIEATWVCEVIDEIRFNPFESIIVAANDTLVDLFLNKIIQFTDIKKELFNLIKLKEFQKYKKICPLNVNDILELNDYVRFKINSIRGIIKY